MEEKKEIPTIVVVRPRPLAVGDLVFAGRVVRKSSQQITCNTWANREDYTLDYIFPYNVTQSEIFDCIISPLVNHALDGYTSLAVLYGQTGTGKTYTLLGDEPKIIERYKDSSIGQIPRALLHIFEYLRRKSSDHDVLVSFFEVYNEIPRDLLAKANPWGDDDDKAELKCLDDITEAEVRNYYQFKDMLRVAQRDQESVNAMRHTSQITNVYIINITSVSKNKSGKLVFVELAGAECFGKFDEMERFSRQLVGTRKTLYALNKVIIALNSREDTIPYMESKLTRILRNILNPSCQIAVIATISPCARSLKEIANTLDYAEQLRFENRRCKLRFLDPKVEFSVQEPPFEMEIMVHKVQQMRDRINNVFQEDIVNYKRLECIINSVDDLYDEIKMMETECANVYHNYGFLAENISAELHRPDERGDNVVRAVELRSRQRNLESILEPLAKWKDRINFFVTTYNVISVIGDSRLRFRFNRINHLPPKFRTFHLPTSHSTQPSQKSGESSPVTFGVLTVKIKSKKKRRRNKWAKNENVQLVDEPINMQEDQKDVEKQETQEVESVESASCHSLGTSKSTGDLEVKERNPSGIGYWRKESEETDDESAKSPVCEIPSAHDETTSDVKNSSPKHKEQSSGPAGSKQLSAKSTASVEGVKKNVQDVMKMLEEVRDQLEKLQNE